MATGPSTQTGKTTTARPARQRATKATTPATKATTPDPAATEDTRIPTAVEAPTVPAANALKLVLEHTGTTKRYELFEPDADAQKAGTVGKLYFPLGTKVVKVLATE